MMKLSLILMSLGHFFGLTVLFANTSMADVVGSLITKQGNLNSSFATFPLAFLVGSTAVVVSIAGMLMNKYGYKKIFLLGAMLGSIGSAICAAALFANPVTALVVYTFGLVLQGFAYGIVNYYRHAAALMGGEEERNRSLNVAIVITSGALAGIVGPGLSALTQYVYPGREFAATCMCICGIQLLHFITLLFTRLTIDHEPGDAKNCDKASQPRSFFQLVFQAKYLYPFITATVANGLMILIMGITPLVLKNNGFNEFMYLAFIVQGHVVCMFLPSFLASHLIGKFSAEYVALFGIILSTLGAGVYLINDGSPWHQYASIAVSMALIGLGWNFSFVCSTTLLTLAYNENEKFKAQAFNDTCIFGFGAILTMASGALLQVEGVQYLIIGCLLAYSVLGCINMFFVIYNKRSNQPGQIQQTALATLEKLSKSNIEEVEKKLTCLLEDDKFPTANETRLRNSSFIESSSENRRRNSSFIEASTETRHRNSSFIEAATPVVYFHANDAEKQFIQHLTTKLSATCTAAANYYSIQYMFCQKPEEESKWRSTITSDCLHNEKKAQADSVKLNTYDEFALITLQLQQMRGQLFFVFEQCSQAQLDSHLTWLNTNKIFIDGLLSSLVQAKKHYFSEHESAECRFKFENATDLQKRVLEELTLLYEKDLMKRTAREHVNDLWTSVGRNEYKKRLWYFVRHDAPLLFVLPAFPFKSRNKKTKVLGDAPDVGEKLALQHLEQFLLNVKNVYEPGGYLVIFSDGRVYCDVCEVSDENTTQYKKAVRLLHKSNLIIWSDLDSFFHKFDDTQKRQALVNIFGTTPEKIEAELKEDADFREVYVGFKVFAKDELLVPKDFGSKRGRKYSSDVAKRMMMRNYSYRQFMRVLFPNHIRLSIHPSKCTTKFSIKLVDAADFGTPWHNVALLQPDGSWSLIRRKAAETNNFKLTTSEDGLPYYINDSSVIFSQKF